MARVSKTKKETQWKEQLEHFIIHKMAQGTAEGTMEDYRYHVRLFFEKTKTSFEDYNALRMAVLRYFADCSSLAPATFNTRRKTLKAFFSWAVSEGVVPDNPMMATQFTVKASSIISNLLDWPEAYRK
jgi:site-specific recombinase XerD